MVFKSKDEAIEAGFRSCGLCSGERDNFPEIVASASPPEMEGLLFLRLSQKSDQYNLSICS